MGLRPGRRKADESKDPDDGLMRNLSENRLLGSKVFHSETGEKEKKRQDQTAALGLLRFFSPSVPTPASDRGPHSRT